MNIINRLKEATADQRPQILTDLFEKNLQFFSQKEPLIHRLVEEVDSPYEIDITADFVDIVDSRSGASVFGDFGAEPMAEALGGWTHQAWEELLSVRLSKHPAWLEHGKTVQSFTTTLMHAFPQFKQRFSQKKVNLSVVEEGKRFSNSVIFSGVFHGLHIAHFLECTELNYAAFYEPDPARFIVSCYFLDYEELDRRFGGLLIHVGDQLTNEFFNSFFVKAYVTGQIWVRVLLGYADEKNGIFLQRLHGFWHSQMEIWAPVDQYFDAVHWTTENIDGGRHVLQQCPQLSDNARIAIVASGPSLANDLIWLKENREKFLVFAAHSAVRPLKAAGIVPDIQFCLDLHMNDLVFESLELDPDVPFLADVRTSPALLQHFNQVLLVAGDAINYSLNFSLLLPHTMPTTGNLCTSFSCFLQPETIYFFGLDMGFKSRSQSHAEGSCYDDFEGLQEKMAGETPLVVDANFSETEMLTNPYFNDARRWIEALLALQPRTQFINCSDGARICGTSAQRSTDLVLADYPEKETDLHRILEAFQPAQEPGRCWQPFNDTMGQVLHDVRQTVKQALKLEKMERLEFARMIDGILFQIMLDRANSHPQDRRCYPYTDILRDVFVAWYRFTVFAENDDEFDFLYTQGKTAVFDVLERLPDPTTI